MASKRHIRRKKCGRKVRHPTMAAALTAVAMLKQRYGDSGMVIAYRCVVCRFFHIGHANKRIKQSIADKRER